MQIPLIAEQGKGYSSPLNATRTVNLYPVMDKGGKQKVALFGCPGSEQWVSVVGGIIDPAGSKWDTSVSSPEGVFSDGDATMEAAFGGFLYDAARANAPRSSGKLYFETSEYTIGGGVASGVCNGGVDTTLGTAPELAVGGGTWTLATNGFDYSNTEDPAINIVPATTNPYIRMHAVDLGTGDYWFGVNGTWSGDPEAGTGSAYFAVSGTVSPATWISFPGASTIRLLVGEFDYPIPDGFIAWGNSVSPDYPIDGPVRGCLELNGIGYFVAGNVFYSVDTGGNVAQRGFIDIGSTPVNVETNGQQVAICDGSSLWIYDITTEAFAQITDPDFPGAGSFAVLDGYGLFNKPGTGQFYTTSLLDFTNVDALDFATAESSPDDLIRVFTNGGTAWMFGKRTIEPWQNDGGELFPFSRVGNVRIQRGLAAVHAVCEAGGSPEFLGDDRIVYRLGGYSPEPVSNEGVEFAISRMSRVDDCIAYSYTQEGHVFSCFKFPSEGTTWVRDLGTGLWHERMTGDASWRANCMMKLGNRQLIGDDSTPRLLEIRTDLYADDGDEMVASHVLPTVAEGTAKIPHMRFELDVESGVGSLTGSDPSVVLDWSDDGGRTWSNFLTRKLGKVGEYLTRAIFNKLGSSRQRNYRIRISDPVKRVILAAHLNGEDTGK